MTKAAGMRGELERADAMILPRRRGVSRRGGKLVPRQDMLQSTAARPSKKPILGICLGMQLLFEHPAVMEVQETDGLALVPGRVERIETNLKLPHIGWNSLHSSPSPLFAGLGEGVLRLLVHSFCGNTADPKAAIASTDYRTQVTAAVQNGTVFGTQFHPEKVGGNWNADFAELWRG